MPNDIRLSHLFRFSEINGPHCEDSSWSVLHHNPPTFTSPLPERCYGVILGNVYENFKMFNNIVKENDCIVGPMCEFEFHSYADIPRGAWIKIEVPHIVRNHKIERKIRVISRDRYQDCIEYAIRLQPKEELPGFDFNPNIYYRVSDTHVDIFTQHFSQFIVYAENSSMQEVTTNHNCCARYVEMLSFAKWTKGPAGYLDVIVYISFLQHKQVF